MHTSGNEGARMSSPANTSLPTDLQDSLFFDPPAIDNSFVSTPLQGSLTRSYLSVDLEETSGAETSPQTTAAASCTDIALRRGQAYRRTDVGGRGGTTPRVRSLEGVAMNMQTYVGRSRPATSAATPASAASTPALTRAVLAEHVEASSWSHPLTPPDSRDTLPLLPMRDFATAATASAAASDTPPADAKATTPTALRPSEDAEGSVHVATRSSRMEEPLESLFLSRQLTGSAADSGFELSMESVTLQISERHFFRAHPITYLDDCSLHIAPGSMHCIASLNPAHARAALAVLAGVDTVASARGATLANALPASSLRYRRQVAYVASLDCCTAEATVYDNLAFATRIRYVVDAPTLREVVEQAASEAFLMDQLLTRASDLGPAQRYLLATAMELVADPTVLLLQDPLAFFSLAELQLFTQLLRSVRRRNPARTVVWSGSAIPWTLFDSIDSLTLLTTGGKTFYSGNKEGVESFLQEDLGILRVPGEDVMDIMAQTEVDVVAVTDSTVAFRNSKFYRAVQHEIEAHRTRVSANAFSQPPEPPHPSPSYASVQSSLLLYTLRRSVLDKAALVPWVGLFVVMVLVCMLVAATDGKQERSLQNTCGVLFLLLSCSVQINSIFLKSELRDWRTFLSFRNNLCFPVLPYYVATVVRLLVPRLCFAVASSICGAVIFAEATAASLSAMMSLLSFAHACLGLIAVYWVPRVEMLMAANHLYYAYCVICCGFLLSVTQIPVFFQVLSLLRIAYGGLLAKEIGALTWCDTASGDDLSGSAASDSSSSCLTGQKYLTLMGLQQDSLGQSVLGLSLLSLVMMAALAISMHLSPSAKLFSSSS
ncbi:hypothetical protein ABB37_04400 [Leptomonas pyrrhocoris]|uniref:ABC transporter domain-containing protein n=1 Tax=Leptomonas pyrrhocoris TaxID=157538 RepID=A0A0N0DW44_LEPPY|nr:hypothetical protein ABB37_04400 [Leptomonas pyrrhocoris]XP_015659470.1 hypothetical protein ABB37_04400 [Leptomonas pyrrhocoris]KPA81030.1 hypothetical protein ABB37_04400 [Leptomonas pyrrhocoris]KPA81031.1 hypothetical protein ABB37_04400 [Leptomonas pyrrhocoris]|eukprot:XP_015659469.1 hypothetical protein ABB37_04400 [Leptomonas pyrrhocoris]